MAIYPSYTRGGIGRKFQHQVNQLNLLSTYIYHRIDSSIADHFRPFTILINKAAKGRNWDHASQFET